MDFQPRKPAGAGGASIWSRPWLHAVGLVALCLAVYLPGLVALPVVDRDEARFAQASRQMIESATLPPSERDPLLHNGGWAVPMVQDKPRLNKPPMTYWLQGACAWALSGGDVRRDAIWMYRVPSVFGATLGVLGTWVLGRRMFAPAAALLGAGLLAVCPIVAFDAHQARSDELLLGATTWTMVALWSICRRAWRGEPVGWWRPLTLWLLVALGVLVKGPITPMIVVLAALASALARGRWRWLRRLRPLLGIVIVAACVAPWVIAVARHVGWHTYWTTVWNEVIGRSTDAREGHWGPPGYYIVGLALFMWPASLAAIAAMVQAWRAAGIRLRSAAQGEHAELFLLAWIIPAWIVFELIGTKLPHYTLPMYPALALLCARALLMAATEGGAALQRIRGKWTLGLIVWTLLGVGIVLGVPDALLWYADAGRLPPATLALLAVAAVTLAVGVVAAFHTRPGALVRGVVIAGAALVVSLGTVFVQILPGDRPWWVTQRIVAAAKKVHPSVPTGELPAMAACGYVEDSMVFAARGRLTVLAPASIPGWAQANPGGVLVCPSGWDPRGMEKVDQVHGIDYANGKDIDLTLWKVPWNR